MFGHSKKRVSLGGIIVVLAAIVLLVISIGAGTGTAAVAVAPANTALPKISGTARVGETLTTTDGTWANSPTSFAYLWLRCSRNGKNCSTIPAATAKTYMLVVADQRQTIRVRVTATNADGSTAAESTQTGVIAAASGAAPEHCASHDHRPRQGRPDAAAGEGAWSGKPTGYTYAWQRCDADVASCANIVGATGKSYTVTVASLGYRFRVTVTAKNAKGTAAANSAITASFSRSSGHEQAPVDRDRLGPLHRPGHLRPVPDLRRLPQERDDHRHGLASRSRLVYAALHDADCTEALWRLHTSLGAGCRFRGHGKYTVTLRARDKSGLTSLAAHRTFTR